MSLRSYSTKEAAAAVGISRATLHAWIAAGKFEAPRPQVFGKVRVRAWTKTDIARLRRVKVQIYTKGKTGRPRKMK